MWVQQRNRVDTAGERVHKEAYFGSRVVAHCVFVGGFIFPLI